MSDEGRSFPAVATIAREAGMNVRNAQQALRRLEGLGELKSWARNGRSTEYALMVRGVPQPLWTAVVDTVDNCATPVASDTPSLFATPVASDTPPLSLATPESRSNQIQKALGAALSTTPVASDTPSPSIELIEAADHIEAEWYRRAVGNPESRS